MGQVRYGRLTFNPDFQFARGDQNEIVRFSKSERLLLARFTSRPGLVLSRDDLLDAVSGPGSDATDRNIDFVITRLRRKLRDSARTPSYIATRYGEGYVWIAEAASPQTDAHDAFLIVGPLRGLAHIGPLEAHARAYAEALRHKLDQRTPAANRVVLDENCPPLASFGVAGPRFAIELNFVRAGSRLDCATALRAVPTGQIIRLSRDIVADGEEATYAPRPDLIEKQAGEIADVLWDALTLRGITPADPLAEPLAVRMHQAATMVSNAQSSSWQENQRRVLAQLEQNPNDHQARLMLATSIHSKYLQSGPPILLPQHDIRAQDEDQIERLVLASLPHLQDNPIFLMAAGKLLYFIDRGHRPLAIQLVEDAFESSTALATSFAILGQMRMHEGQIEAAVALLDQGLELCEAGSDFELYLLVLKCQALLAANRRDDLAPVLETFYGRRPGIREFFSIYYASGDPDEATPEMQYVLGRIDEAHARAMLTWLNYVAARLFRIMRHRENILRGTAMVLVQRFGPRILSEEVRTAVPALADMLAGNAVPQPAPSAS
jgi:DNA-binding winged helix-turn-helix (wHTH) protein